MKGCDVVIFKNGKVANAARHICSCMNLHDGSPVSTVHEGCVVARAMKRRLGLCKE